VSNQGNRDRDQEGNVGQAGKDSANPTGTSGRHENWPKAPGDPNRPARSKPAHNDQDEDSALGNRTGFR
jgi:hypothetical protein